MSTLQQSAQLSQLDSLVEQVAATQNLQNLLESLPDRTRRSVMVPFGAVAFFPGQLVHTNEALVNLGAGIIAEKSTKETVNLLRQRQIQLEAQITALKQQQPAVHDSQQQAGSVTASQAMLQSPEDQEPVLDIRKPYDEHLHGQSQTCTPSKHMQHQIPHATVTSDTTAPSLSGMYSEQPNSPTHQAVDDLPAHPHCNSGGEALDAAGVTVGGAAGVAEEPRTLRQQACATDDGEFERMMAKLDDLERQEAAANGRASAAGASGSTPHPNHLQQQQSPARQQQRQEAAVMPSSTPASVEIHHIKPPTGLRRGFLSGKASRTNSKTSQQAVSASSASQGTSRVAQGTSEAGQRISRAVEPQLQRNNSERSSKPAFTGSVVERPALSKSIAALDEPPVHAQQSSSGGLNTSTQGLTAASSSGQVADQAVPRKVSKFKQSRSAK